MIQVQTELFVADNTGAKKIECIKVLGGSKRRYASIGDTIVVAVKEAIPKGKVKKGSVHKAVVVRVKKGIHRNDGSKVKFDNNAAVLVDEKGEPVEARMINNSIERAQRKVEGRNFDIRKNLLDYDDVANDQRQVIYEQRNELMESSDISDMVSDIRSEVVDELVSEYIPPQSIDDQWDIGGLARTLKTEFDIEQFVVFSACFYLIRTK